MTNSMKNELKDIPSFHPVVIIGGGIVGSGIFRELSLHQVGCLLIDKFDFSSQTSQSSSKMLHGGIRYLENMDFSLVWEALKEKNRWLEIAPHLCYPKHFSMPVYKESSRPLWMIHAGVFIYDILSGFKNMPHKRTNKEQTLEEHPYLRDQGLKGAGVYSDAIVDDAKMTLECIYDGLKERDSYACNYTSLVKAERKKDSHNKELYFLTMKDEITGQTREIVCEHLVFATGPFTDRLLKDLNLFSWTPKLILSKGSHLWFSKEDFPLENPVVLTPDDGRVIFVIPQGNKVLVGTTEKAATSEFNQGASQEEIEYLLNNLREYFPKAQLAQEHILASFAGLRPLVREDEGSDLGKVARHHKIYQPQDHAYVILGGKYTTFRVMASDLVKILFSQMKKTYHPELSLTPFRQKSTYLPWKPIDLDRQKLKTILDKECPKTFEDLILRRMGVWSLEEAPHIREFLKENESLWLPKLRVPEDWAQTIKDN